MLIFRAGVIMSRVAHTPGEMLSAVSKSLASRTGRSLDQWAALVQASGVDPLDQKAVRGWLRAEHGVPQNSQWAIADAAARSAGWVPPTVAEYVDGQYAGAKAALRPICEVLAAAGLGDDVTIEGRSGYFPFVRVRHCGGPAARAGLAPHLVSGPVVGFAVRDLAAAVDEPRNAGVDLLGEPGPTWQHFRGPDGDVRELVAT
jgi:hypothetical protein